LAGPPDPMILPDHAAWAVLSSRPSHHHPARALGVPSLSKEAAGAE
jgi:hypothetical protein